MMTLHFQLSPALTRGLWLGTITGGDVAIFPPGGCIGGVTPWLLLTIGIPAVVFI